MSPPPGVPGFWTILFYNNSTPAGGWDNMINIIFVLTPGGGDMIVESG